MTTTIELFLPSTNTKEYVVQRGLTQTPEQQNLLLLKRGNATEEIIQIHLLLRNRKGGDERTLFHKLQIVADVRLHILHHIRNCLVQFHREHQATAELVLQMDLTANTAQSIVCENGNTCTESIGFLHGVSGE